MSILFYLGIARIGRNTNGNLQSGKNVIIVRACAPSHKKYKKIYKSYINQIMENNATRFKPKTCTVHKTSNNEHLVHVLTAQCMDNLILYFAVTTVDFGREHIISNVLFTFKNKQYTDQA